MLNLDALTPISLANAFTAVMGNRLRGICPPPTHEVECGLTNRPCKLVAHKQYRARLFYFWVRLIVVMLATALPAAANASSFVSGFFVAQGGIYFANGSGGAACAESYDLALLQSIQMATPNLSYFPSLKEVDLSNIGPCTSSVPAGNFFTMDGTIYYTNGSGLACSYSNVPATINTASLTAYPAFPTDLGLTNQGVCSGWGGANQYPTSPLPAANAYFVTQGGVFFSNGAGHACQATYDSLLLQGINTKAFGFPYFPSLAQAGLVNDGLCARPNVEVGGFMVSDGSVYYVGADNNACEYSFAGGLDASSMTVYPTFPSDIFVNNGQCAVSPYIDIMNFGAVGNGVHDDTEAIQEAITAAETSGQGIYFPPRRFLVASSNVSLSGQVTFRGLTSPQQLGTVAGAVQQIQPPQILVQGTVDPPIAVPNRILRGATTISASNVFQANQILVLNNFPTDAAGSDSCDNLNGQCCYGGLGSEGQCNSTKVVANQRQFRRRELIQVASATSNNVTLTSPVNFDYETLDTYGNGNPFYPVSALTGYAFLSLIHPTTSVTISGITLQGMSIEANNAQNFTVNVPSAQYTSFLGQTCYTCTFEIGVFDAEQTFSQINFSKNSFNVQVRATVENGIPTTGEHGIVELDQVITANVNVILGAYTSTGCGTQPDPYPVLHGVMIDTNYEEVQSGFTDVPDLNVTANVSLQGGSANGCHDIQVTADPFSAPVVKPTLELYGAPSVCIKGATNIADPYQLSGNSLVYSNSNSNGGSGTVTANSTGAIALQLDESSNLVLSTSSGSSYQSVQENTQAVQDVRNSSLTLGVTSITYGGTIASWTGGC